jgi:hypothetical protein
MAIKANFDPITGLLSAAGDKLDITITTMRHFLGTTVMRKMRFGAVCFSRFRWVNAIQGEMSIHWLFAKATRTAAFLASGILLCATSGWLDPALAQIFRVQVNGTFTGAVEDPPHITPGTPFSTSFLVNTNAAPVLHQNAQGLPVVGYADAAISGFSVTVGGVTFTQSDILDRVAVAGAPGAAVFFSQDLANGATPSIDMFVENQTGSLDIGVIGCSGTCEFENELFFETSGFPRANDSGVVSVSASRVFGFAGTPGAIDCHGQSVSALTKQYQSIKAAAGALNYPSVQALQDDITLFCGN